jgi:hypothetical protein
MEGTKMKDQDCQKSEKKKALDPALACNKARAIVGHDSPSHEKHKIRQEASCFDRALVLKIECHLLPQTLSTLLLSEKHRLEYVLVR